MLVTQVLPVRWLSTAISTALQCWSRRNAARQDRVEAVQEAAPWPGLSRKAVISHNHCSASMAYAVLAVRHRGMQCGLRVIAPSRSV